MVSEVVEAPITETVETPVAEPDEQAPPTPDEPEGDAPAESEGDEPKDYSAIEDELNAEADKRAEALLAEKLAALEQRGKQRTVEQEGSETARIGLLAAAREEVFGNDVSRTPGRVHHVLKFIDQFKQGEEVEPQLKSSIDAYAASRERLAVLEAAQDDIADLLKWRDELLPDITDAEVQKLDDPTYKLRRAGNVALFRRAVTDAKVARLETENADLKKQLGNRTSIKAAAEKLAQLQENVGAAEPKTPKGVAAPSGPLTVEEAQTLSIEELKRRGYA